MLPDNQRSFFQTPAALITSLPTIESFLDAGQIEVGRLSVEVQWVLDLELNGAQSFIANYLNEYVEATVRDSTNPAKKGFT